MKKLLITAISISSLFAGSMALADNHQPTTGQGVYLGLQGGAAINPNKLVINAGNWSNTYAGGNGAFAVGYRHHNWRTDLSLGYAQNAMIKVKGDIFSNNVKFRPGDGYIAAYTAMVNGYYDINTSTNFVPYVGAGVGVARLRYNVKQFDGQIVNFIGSTNTFAYQGTVGLGYQFTNKLRGSLSYEYLGTTSGAVKKGGAHLNSNYKNNFINLGVNYFF